jgi:hypothetical protein
LRFRKPFVLSNESGGGHRPPGTIDLPFKDKRMRNAVILVLFAALAAFAADLAGTWKGSLETPMGTMEVSATLKADGSSFAGTVNMMGGDQKIEKVKIDGDKISFEVPTEMASLAFSGTVSGDEMKLKMNVMDQEVPLVLKRAK